MTQEAKVPDEFMQQMRRMVREEVANVYRSAPMRNSSISEGGTFTLNGGQFRVNYPESQGGGLGTYIGDNHATGTGEYLGTGVLIQDTDGTDIASFRSDVSGNSLAVIRDGEGNAVLYTDTTSGQGFGRPYLPVVFYRQRYTDWPSTTSATFEGIFKAEVFKQNSRLSMAVQVAVDDAATTGELEVLVNGVQLGPVQPIPFGIRILTVGPAAVAGAHMTVLSVEIRARRTAGTGTVRVEPLHAYGR